MKCSAKCAFQDHIELRRRFACLRIRSDYKLIVSRKSLLVKILSKHFTDSSTQNFLSNPLIKQKICGYVHSLKILFLSKSHQHYSQKVFSMQNFLRISYPPAVSALDRRLYARCNYRKSILGSYLCQSPCCSWPPSFDQ